MSKKLPSYLPKIGEKVRIKKSPPHGVYWLDDRTLFDTVGLEGTVTSVGKSEYPISGYEREYDIRLDVRKVGEVPTGNYVYLESQLELTPREPVPRPQIDETVYRNGRKI